MAGTKHGRSGGGSGGSSGGGSGEVSPLAAQLQQAWLQTQMPKSQKRSFTSIGNSQSQPSRMALSGLGVEAAPPSTPSALSALSSLFPELANVQEEKKAMISSVFEDGVRTVPQALALRQKKTSECLGFMFGEDGVEFKNMKPKMAKAPPDRSYSTSLIQPSGDSSLEFSDSGSLSTSHSFSESSYRNTPDDSEYDAAAEAHQQKAPLFDFLSEILMDENLEDKKCMFQEMSAYQAMARELGDLISFEPPPMSVAEFSNSEFQSSAEFQPYAELQPKLDVHSDSEFQPNFDFQANPEFQANSEFVAYSDFQANPDFQFGDDKGGLDSWIDEILSGPLPAELRDTPEAKAQKTVQSPDGPYSQTDSGLGSTTSWTDGKDTDSEVVECQKAFADPSSSFSPADSGTSSLAYENGSGSGLLVESKVLMPSSNGNSVHKPTVDLTNLLLRCAQAVEQSDYGHANELVHELRPYVSPYGNASERVAHYFLEALVARMSGTGGQLYSALSNNRPSEAEMLKAQMLFCECCPFTLVPQIYANCAIMEAFKGAQRVHIIDYGILYGVQWPCLLHQLAEREGGPPRLRITGIDRPQPGFRPSARIQDTGRRLARLAKAMGVPFEFHAIAEKWEAITPAHLMLREDEVLAVNSMFRLRHLLDESVTAASPRNLLLSRIKSLNPKVFVQGVLNAGYNAPFFMTRFREALAHFSTLFDMMENSFPPEHPVRQTIDHEIIGREILNVVACEGLERVERTETYRQWQARTMRAGFQQMPSSRDVMAKIRAAMLSYDRDFGIGEDGSWFLLGWKERITHAVTVWEPIPDTP